jgi:hypothetical protein
MYEGDPSLLGKEGVLRKGRSHFWDKTSSAVIIEEL